MLESNHGQRITTAKLAEASRVSEAALYRHIPKQSSHVEGLMNSLKKPLFLLAFNKIMEEKRSGHSGCQLILHHHSGFA